MLTLTRILCPTDFSDVSAKAERYAVALAKRYEAQLSLLHVLPSIPTASFGEVFVDIRSFEEARAQVDRDLRAARERAEAAGVVTSTEIREGAPAREVLEAARELGVDLIVLGTHGRGGVEHLLLGSVAEKVLRKATCPVMVVPPTADADRGVLFSRLLCPTDGSPACVAAVAFAVSLARETDGAITLMQVVEPLLVVSEIAVVEASAYEAQAEAQARAMLREAVADDVREWCRIEEAVVVGTPSERILTAAHDRAADVIVMGVRGRNALDLLAFGSTTNAVVRRAECPVLVVHPQIADRRPGVPTAAAAGA